MTIFLLVMMLYTFAGSLVGTRFCSWRMAECTACHDQHTGVIGRNGRPVECQTWHTAAALWVGLGWPLAIPGVIGHLTSARVDPVKQQDRRRMEEVKEAQHQLTLAQIREQENKMMNRMLEAGPAEQTSHVSDWDKF